MVPESIDRFTLHELLKRHNGVATYAGVDSATREPVVVKVVASVDVSTAELLRLEHEAHVLAALSDHGFPLLIASGTDGDQFYLAQPRHKGVPLDQRLHDGPLGVPDALVVAVDVLARLQLAHDHGILHRDVKPGNIVIRHDGHAELVDFGFALSTQLDESIKDAAVGTLRYVAPEAAGLIHREIDHRADLYSFGVVLFEMLAGAPPFASGTAGTLLRQHLNAEPPRLRSLGVAAPAAVDDVVQRLLAKEPCDRYQSAAAAHADLQEIARQLASGVAEPAMTPGRHDVRHTLTDPPFLGRRDELALFNDMLDLTHQGEGGLVLLEAESGGGKSRMLDEVKLEAERRGHLVLRGHGVQQAAQQPYQLLDGVALGLDALGSDAPELQRLRTALGGRVDPVLAALPRLAATLGSAAGSDAGPEAFGEARTVDALAALLDALGSSQRPAVVILDDTQWADSLALALLQRWHADRQRERCHVLIVAAFRSEEVPDSHPLRRLTPRHHLVLPPLTTTELEDLCTSMAGHLPRAAQRAIARLAGGSPFMAAAVLRGMVEAGLLQGSRTGWTITEEGLADVQTSRRAALHLARRFALLSPAALALARVGAVLGKDFDLELALELAQLDQEAATDALHEARQRRMLWVDEAEDHCVFTHDKLRETLLEGLEPDVGRELHRRAAELIERQDPSRIFELAYHYDAAGDGARALPHALRAADLARERHALQAAAQHYRIAERSSGGADAATRGRIAEGLGDVLTLAGAYDDAAVALQRALELAADPTRRAVVESKLGDVAFKRGDQVTARHYLEGALRHLGRWVPRNGMARLAATVVEAVIQVLHTVLPRLFSGRRSLEGAETELFAVRMYSRLAYIYWFSAGAVPCAWAHLRGMNLAERYPPTLELAQAYSEHAPVMTMLPWFRRGLAYARRSYEIRRDQGDKWGQGQSHNFTGVTLYADSRYRECIEQCQEAVRVLERTGDRWEQNTARWQMAFAHHRLGELATAAEISQELYSTASALGDQTAAGVALSGWARATGGRVPEAFLTAALARDDDDAHTASEVHLAAGLRHLHDGALDQALESFQRADTIVRRAGLRQEFVAPVPCWLATVRRLLAEEASGPERRRLVRNAWRAAKRADRLARLYRNNRPHTLRERGLAEALRGRRRRAERLLMRSQSVAERQGAAYEAAQTRVARLRAEVARGRSEAASRLAAAEADLSAFLAFATAPDSAEMSGNRPTLSVADRFESMLRVARNIAGAPSEEAIFEAVRKAALLLLRGEHCQVVRVDGTERSPRPAAASPSEEVSSSLLAKAVTDRVPVVASIGSTPGVSDSLVLAEHRSALCAPIVSEGRVSACLYVSHRRVDDLFADVEVQLAAFITTLAGAALEHVAGTEARFRALVQHSTDVVTVLNREGTILYMSDSVEQVLGYHASELIGSNLRALLDPTGAESLLANLAPGGWPADKTGPVESKVRHQDGTWRDVETTVTTMLDDPRVRGVVLNTRDVTERIALQDELRKMAWHDSLTGLANRAQFTLRVEEALAERVRNGRPVSVAFVDLNGFKAVNDTFGHHGGDLLLKEVAARLREGVRPGDTIARWGGDEFALLLADADATAATGVAERLLEHLDAPFSVLGREVHTGASVGLAVADAGDDAESLLRAADSAMYAAKATGRSRYELFDLHLFPG